MTEIEAELMEMLLKKKLTYWEQERKKLLEAMIEDNSHLAPKEDDILDDWSFMLDGNCTRTN